MGLRYAVLLSEVRCEFVMTQSDIEFFFGLVNSSQSIARIPRQSCQLSDGKKYSRERSITRPSLISLVKRVGSKNRVIDRPDPLMFNNTESLDFKKNLLLVDHF